MSRLCWLRLHRYAGLALAILIPSAGLTGSIIAFEDELDAWLNPELFRTTSEGVALSSIELVAHVEHLEPHVRVTYVPLKFAPGKSLPLRRFLKMNIPRVLLPLLRGKVGIGGQAGRVYPCPTRSFTPTLALPRQGGGNGGGKILARNRLSAAHRHYLASSARENMAFVQVILFPKPWRYF